MPKYAKPFSKKQIERGEHRTRVGGKWQRLGVMQFEYMKGRGLEPGHRLLDVGCGALRGGRYFIDYLEPGHYYGLDVNATLLDAGYERELEAHQRDRLPRENLRETGRFESDFGVAFDYALAQSVFTHMSLNRVRLALYQVAKVLKPGGEFYATFFEGQPGTELDAVLHLPNRDPQKKKSRMYTERNHFWYYATDLEWACSSGPWKFEYLGDWGHPVGQQMVKFTRTRGTQRRSARLLGSRR